MEQEHVQGNRFVISVLTRDRVAVIAEVSEALFALGANLEALSQTVVWGWFTMIVCASFPKGVDAARIKGSVESAGEFSATVFPFEGVPRAVSADGSPYVVSAVGRDKAGIVRRLTRCFAGRGINIEDVWNEVRDGQFIVIFHVTIPPGVDRREIRMELEQAAAELGIEAAIQHQDVFTATNSLEVHTRPRPPR